MKKNLDAVLGVVLLTGCAGSPVTRVTQGAMLAPAQAAPAAYSTLESGQRAQSSLNTPKTVQESTSRAPQPSAPAAGDYTAATMPSAPSDLLAALSAIEARSVRNPQATLAVFAAGEAPANAAKQTDKGLAAMDAGAIDANATPVSTQAKADRMARSWAADAQELYVGWGFKGRLAIGRFFGYSRHAYYSQRKNRLFYVDFDFFGSSIANWESGDILQAVDGQFLSSLLDEPRGIYPISGRQAFDRCQEHGYSYYGRPTSTIKAILLAPRLMGPKWIFLDAANKPSLVVDAQNGKVSWEGWLLNVARLLVNLHL